MTTIAAEDAHLLLKAILMDVTARVENISTEQNGSAPHVFIEISRMFKRNHKG
jgi:hypothetical protein